MTTFGNFSDWAYATWQFIPAYFYERTSSSNNFGTICLPREASTEYAEVYSIANIADNSLSLTKLADDEWMEAGKPYLFKAIATNPTFTMKGDAVDAPVEALGLVGTFTEITAPQGDNYFVLNNNKLYIVDYDGVTIDAYRAYIDITNVTAGVKGAVTLDLIYNAPTAVTVPFANGRQVVGEIYDLTGRRVQSSILNLQSKKGIYIVNGQKVAVK